MAVVGYTVNYTNPQTSTQTKLLPLFEDHKHYKIHLNVNPGQIPKLEKVLYLHI